MTVEQIAKVLHQANKAVCEIHGDFSQVDWEQAEQWQRDAAIAGVQNVLNNPNLTSKEMHALWSAQKKAAGWVYGPVKDGQKKTHPCLIPYEELPQAEADKNNTIVALVNALK